MSEIYKDVPRYTKCQAAAGPRPAPRGRAGRGGPAAPWYFVYLVHLGYIYIYIYIYWIYLGYVLDIFAYMLVYFVCICLIYALSIFGILLWLHQCVTKMNHGTPNTLELWTVSQLLRYKEFLAEAGPLECPLRLKQSYPNVQIQQCKWPHPQTNIWSYSNHSMHHVR